jgi:hypothetical protein
MKTQKRTTPYLLLMTLAAAGCFLIPSAAQAEETSSGSSQEVNQLLSEVKSEAIALERDCDYIAIWAGGKQPGWKSHAGQLSLIREHINKAGRLLTNLHDVRDTASPWQQQAIDRIYPMLKELADNTEEMINLHKDHGSAFRFSEYRDYAKAGYELAEDLAALVRDYVEYGEHEAEFHRLHEKLNSTAS